ncbi:MAG TPA: hypothetical protein DCE71_00355 [Parachlamydiales bacterium]|nr:hypothetical protein [Parachlamydiales bacterium]
MLIGVILENSIDAVLSQMQQLKGRVDVAEIRLDYLEPSAWSRLALLKEKACLPLLFTFRKQEQGGHLAVPEKKRLALYEEALALLPAFADIETDTDPAFIERIKTMYPQISLIGSFHDFEKTPEDLASLLESMHPARFSMVKIAVKARSTLDLLRLMVFAKKMSPKCPLSCIAMGEYGQPSRVLGPIVGNVLHYTSLHDAVSSLYQYSLDTLENLYHFSSLTQKTKIYALLGDPIEASRGHLFHNEIFHREGVHAVYVKLRLKTDELASFFDLALKLPFGGFSVTMPLKEAILPLLTRVDPAALAIGAVNTVIVQGQNLIGSNTDAPGALLALEMHGKVQGKKIAILGAGGAARAIAYEAMRKGAEVALFNRTTARGEKIAKDFGCKAYALDSLSAHPYDLLINTIPVDSSGALPILATEILPDALVMDINPVSLSSPLLRAAREKKCLCVDGDAMFEQQGRLQQLAFQASLTV